MTFSADVKNGSLNKSLDFRDDPALCLEPGMFFGLNKVCRRPVRSLMDVVHQ